MTETIHAVHRPHYSPGTRTLHDLAGPLLLGLAKDLEQAAGGDVSDYGRLHRVRILGKRLRYAMEVFVSCFEPAFRQEVYPAVEEMQEILGRANDSHVAGQRLTALRETIKARLPDEWKRFKPGMDGLLECHQERLPEERQHFLAWWDRWRKAGGGARLAALLQAAEPAAR